MEKSRTRQSSKRMCVATSGAHAMISKRQAELGSYLESTLQEDDVDPSSSSSERRVHEHHIEALCWATRERDRMSFIDT